VSAGVRWRALYELNVDGICANTAAAKGRVERAHLTLQDRLVKELRLEGISTIEAANALLLHRGLQRALRDPRDKHDAHRACARLKTWTLYLPGESCAR
jgi:hypothetical protein